MISVEKACKPLTKHKENLLPHTCKESKQHVTFPFWISTCGGGCANLHSLSERVHLLRANSRHTSSVSQCGSFGGRLKEAGPIIMLASR